MIFCKTSLIKYPFTKAVACAKSMGGCFCALFKGKNGNGKECKREEKERGGVMSGER